MTGMTRDDWDVQGWLGMTALTGMTRDEKGWLGITTDD